MITCFLRPQDTLVEKCSFHASSAGSDPALGSGRLGKRTWVLEMSVSCQMSESVTNLIESGVDSDEIWESQKNDTSYMLVEV
jgi:hypothetical protein